MKLNDLNISTQLRLGFGVILTLIILFGILASRQKDSLWTQTQNLYEHPFAVTLAIGKLQTHAEALSRRERDLFLAKTDLETQADLEAIDLIKADIERQFAILNVRYLGSPDDVTALHDAFLKLYTTRAETHRLLREGKADEALERIRHGGLQQAQADAAEKALKTITTFALGKGDSFYQAAREQKNTINRHLIAALALVLVLSLLITRLLIKLIKAPLNELTDTTAQFRRGNLDARIRFSSANEFGALAAAFNTMADALQAQRQNDKNTAHLADIMLREHELHGFCRELLKALLDHTQSQMGAIYFLNEDKTAFAHFDSIGLGAGDRAAFSATGQVGEFGLALATRKIQRIQTIPEDTRFTFTAVSGTFMPREILTIPVLSENTVTAVISLASLQAYSDPALRLVNESWSMINARVNGVLAFRKINDFAVRLDSQNRELDEQKRELAAQTNELTEQNTELEIQKNQLDEASRLKSAFLSNMSHELRTPLNSVIALSGVLHRRLANAIPADEYSYLEIIERNGKTLLALINDILDLSRIEAGRMDVTPSRFSIQSLIGEIVDMLTPQALEKHIQLVNRVEDSLPLLDSDPDKCRHILQNLIGNAVKFTESGSVEISARREANELWVAVRDTGIGIESRHLSTIFDEFRQADDSTSRKFGGSGLGLAIAKKFARLIKGHITVESEPGKGSTFTLRIPLALAGATPPAEPAPPSIKQAAAGSAPLPSGQGKTVLLVEDNEPAIIQVTDILRREGYRIQAARNGKEALAQIEKQPPDAMILDLMMPEVDGFQVLRDIRSKEKTERLPVLILTAKHVTKEELNFLTGNHIHQLIQKGDVDKNGLLAAVARMVAPPRAEARAERAALPRPARREKPVILVAEDNPDNRRTARALLSDLFHVIEAEDGRAAVEQARLHKPDIILTDLALPVMDGFAALEAIRKDQALSRTPVIAVTASAMKGTREEILARGFDGYISKPIDHDTLMKTIQAFLETPDARSGD